MERWLLVLQNQHRNVEDPASWPQVHSPHLKKKLIKSPIFLDVMPPSKAERNSLPSIWTRRSPEQRTIGQFLWQRWLWNICARWFPALLNEISAAGRDSL